MRKCITVVLCGLAPLLSMCQQQAPAGRRTATTTRNEPSDVRNKKMSEVIAPAPQFVDHVLLGSELGSDGTVSKESDSIAAGHPVYLTMVFRESPPGLQASAEWTTIDKKPVRTERKVMNGAKVATFGLNQKLKPGRYKVVGYWGGNIAAEREFEIVRQQAKQAKRKKG